MCGLKKYSKQVKELLQLPIIKYSKEDAFLSAEIEFEAERNGTPVHRTDNIIAAIAVMPKTANT